MSKAVTKREIVVTCGAILLGIFLYNFQKQKLYDDFKLQQQANEAKSVELQKWSVELRLQEADWRRNMERVQEREDRLNERMLEGCSGFKRR